MPIDEHELRHLERLAALHLGDEERRRLAVQLARVVAFVAQLRELDTATCEPCAHAVDIDTPRRADVARPSLARQEALALSPAADRDFFAVPPVFGGGPEEGADG